MRWIWQAIQDGADVRGYLYWSLLDNFEWAHEFEPQFGRVGIDYATLERKIRPSVYEYAKICKANQLEIDLPTLNKLKIQVLARLSYPPALWIEILSISIIELIPFSMGAQGVDKRHRKSLMWITLWYVQRFFGENKEA